MNMSKLDFSDKKAEVLELLNKIAVLTKEVAEPEHTRENYDYGFTTYLTTDNVNDYVYDEEKVEKLKSELNDDQVFLYCVGQYINRVLSGDPDMAARNEQKYYTSTCY